LILIAVLVVHLIEEVETGFRRKLPVGDMPLRVFVGINVVLYAFCCATLLLSLRDSEWAVPLAWVFAVAMVLNGLGHAGIVAVRGKYFPGGLTAVPLLLAAGYLILQLSTSV
jgi:hypothetical protein